MRYIKKGIIYLFLTALAIFICSPILLLLSSSVMSKYELNQMLFPVLHNAEILLKWKWYPDYPTGEHFYKLLLLTPQFYIVFWNSLKLVVLILAGQLLIAVPAAWSFAIYPFPFRKVLFALYIVLMLMPFQVTMLSQYLVLDGLELMNTHQAIILPAIFSTFPVFLIYRGFRTIPPGLIEAARIDGAGALRIFVSIGLPLGSTGILSAMVLGFLEYWNLIEQPLAFLENKMLWPLSLYLPEVKLEQAGTAFVGSLITLIPAAFVFILGQDYLEQGIISSAMKE